MPRRTADLWVGAIGLVVLILVAGVLLIRAGSHGNGEHGRRATTWSRYDVSGDRLRIEFEGSPCDTGEASLEEHPDRVVVTAYLKASGACIALAAGLDAEVRLRSPLGGRAVYDGACLQRSGTPDDPTCRRSGAEQGPTPDA
jgi:hypothetical protein